MSHRVAAHGAIAEEYQRPSTNDQVAFNYTSEELTTILRPMVETKAEALGSMGDDTPLAMFSNKPRSLFGYFRQRFAEVTNPPIDPLREELVMSLKMRLGARGNFLNQTAEQAHLLELDWPFLADRELAALKSDPELNTVTLSTLVPIVGAGHASAQGEGRPQTTRHLRPRPYIDLITADVSQFVSDSDRRDNAIRGRFLESSQYPNVTFNATGIEGIPDTYQDGQEITFKISGDLTIRDVTKPVTFDVKAKLSGDTLSGEASTTILMSDFGFGPISIAGVLNTEDQAKVTLAFVARP